METQTPLVLVTGATSGVGIVAAQIARRLGARVIATTRSAERGDQLVAHEWADEVVVTGDAVDQSAWPDVDVVIDHVGGPLLMPSLRAMKLAGRYVSVGRLGGMTAEIDLDLVARKRLHLIGVTFRTRSIEQFAAIAAAVTRDLSDEMADPAFGPPISAMFGFEEARQAQDLMAADGHFGKIVVTNP